MKENSQGFAVVRRSASWSNWSWGNMQDKGDVAEAPIDQESRITLQGLNSGKSDDEVREIVAQSDCIPSTTLGKGYRAEQKSTNREGSSVLNETSGWDTDDEEEAWVEWRVDWSINVQWLRRLYFGCIGRR
ncbi:hypothetical protein EAF04_000170 [Stromatinia cepivora]|nr:hypothetical protein EAF04_000170 [Stromatinia cepivora]